MAGTGIGSLPNDYPLPRLAADALSDAPESLKALKYARRFLRGLDHDVDYVDAVIAKAEGRP
ncbi:hypothetical protein CN067_27710 [Sinorhizobium meliloti]|uniref:hypothetical protein n=1 Tax=Rhizobium meliloti TaxID=382 RepID=UPI000FDB70A9|nr:hypothetical protein [Sinorhizobium meliloti]RVQ13924.1 hypothetical protein CN067_27710 [Sinorhizobium meliloti]